MIEDLGLESQRLPSALTLQYLRLAFHALQRDVLAKHGWHSAWWEERQRVLWIHIWNWWQ